MGYLPQSYGCLGYGGSMVANNIAVRADRHYQERVRLIGPAWCDCRRGSRSHVSQAGSNSYCAQSLGPYCFVAKDVHWVETPEISNQKQ